WPRWTHSAGWRMPGNKGRRKGEATHGFADLKHLHKAVVSAAAAAVSRPAATDAVKAVKIAQSGLNQEDAQLFRRAMKTVTPIKDTHRAIVAAPRLAPGDVLRQRRERAVGRDPVHLPQTSDHYSPARMDSDDSRYLRSGHGP